MKDKYMPYVCCLLGFTLFCLCSLFVYFKMSCRCVFMSCMCFVFAEEGSSAAAVAAGVVVVLLLAVVGAAAGFFFFRRHRRY